MSTIPPSAVYTGYWVDYAQGTVLGASLTVKTSTANLLIAFLAFLISVAGMQLWDLVAFCYYLLRVRSGQAGALFHQQQALLRNLPSPGAVVVQFAKLAWSWKAVDRRVWIKCTWPVSLAVLVGGGFVAAGLFSSKVVTSGNFDILVSSSGCGWPTPTTDPDGSVGKDWYKYISESLGSSIQYTKTCYNTSSTSNPACSVYVLPQLPVNISHTSCPFADGMCPYSPAVIMDTGVLDTQTHFGINAKLSDRLQMRRVTTCAPIKTEGYLRVTDPQSDLDAFSSVEGRAPLPGEQQNSWYYGEFLVNGGEETRNFTFFSTSYGVASTPQYTVSTESFYFPGFAEGNTFQPIQEVARTDAEVHLISIASNAVRYSVANDDPIFSAHQQSNAVTSAGNITNYTADKPAGIIGCAEQQQFCNPTTGKCTALADQFSAADDATTNLALSPQQNATLTLLLATILDMGAMPLYPPSPIVATQTLSGPRQYLLPSNQWELEVQAWKEASLAATQKAITDYAVGAGISNPESGEGEHVTPPATPQEETLCKSQKMKAPAGFSNVNVFGLSFIVGICGVIILLNQVLPRALIMFWRKKQLHSDRVLSWTQDGVLQLQRLAFESVGAGDWKRVDSEIPITREKQKMGALSKAHTFASMSSTQRELKSVSDSNTSVAEIKPAELKSAV